MTTQARELAKLVSNAGDVNLGDDISLASDGAILNFGADNDVTLTHVADTGLLLNSTRRLQFGDSGTYIYQSADGVLDLVSDTEIELNATTLDINANVDISGTLTVAGALDFGDLDISNVGSIALDTITNDGTDITLDSSGDITLDADGGDIRFKDGGNTFGYANSANMDFVLGAGTADKDIIFKGNDGGSTITPMTIDMSEGGLVGIGTTSPSAALHVVSDSTSVDALYLESTEASSSAAPILSFKRHSGSPADADYLGQIKFKGENDADQDVVYAKVTGKAGDVSDSSEDGILEFANIKAGSATITARLKSDKLELVNSTALEVGADVSITAGALSITADGNNAVTFTESGAGLMTMAMADDFIVDAGGDIALDADGGDIRFKDGGTIIGTLNNTSSNFCIVAGVQDKDIIFKGDDGGSAITALTLDMSEAGAATFNAGLTLGGNISMMSNTLYANQAYVHDRLGHLNDADTYIDFGVDTITMAAGATALTIDSSQRVGIGTTGPGQRLQVQDTTASDNKSIAHFHGTASAGSATDDGGQFITVTRNSPISQANGVMGGIAFCGNNPNNAGQARIQGNYKYTGGRDMEFLISVDNDTAPRKVLRLDGGTGQAEFIGGATTGLQETYYNNSYMTLADDATFDMTGVANVGAMIVCQAWKKGGSITYPAAIFFLDQLASAGITKVADPQGAWSTSDSDGSWNIFHNGNTNVRIKNRTGVSNRLAVTVFKFLGV